MSAAPLDDLAEFVTGSYQSYLDALDAAGYDAAVEKVGTGAYVLTATSDRRTATVSDGGGPLPPSPGDVAVWTAEGRGRRAMVRAGEPDRVVGIVQSVLRF